MNINDTWARLASKSIIESLGEDSAKLLCNLLDPNQEDTYDNHKTNCQYIITRGEKKGQQCTTHISGDDVYCSKHKKTVGAGSKNTRKKQKGNDPLPKEELKIVEEELVISKDERGRYKEPKSGFLFHNETTVYGKADSDGNIHPLDNHDRMIVKLHGWCYNPDITVQSEQ